MISTECVLCGRGIDHCHGSLVVHSDGTAECTDNSCLELEIDTHELVVECVQLAGGCTCTEVLITA